MTTSRVRKQSRKSALDVLLEQASQMHKASIYEAFEGSEYNDVSIEIACQVLAYHKKQIDVARKYGVSRQRVFELVGVAKKKLALKKKLEGKK